MANNHIKSATTTFEIIEAIERKNGATLTEVATDLDISTSSVHNYLKTLEQAEYVVNEDETYYVGLRFLPHGAHARNRQELYDMAVPEVEQLATETGELVNLLVEEHGRGVFLHHARGANAVQVESRPGTRVGLHSTALGKAILAYLPPDRRREILDKRGTPGQTNNTITDHDALHAEFETIRDRGYAIDDEERIAGLRCVAMPVFDSEETVLGAVSISGPVNRFQGDRFHEELSDKLRKTVDLIELHTS